VDIDVKKVMLALLERQKEYVLEDLEDYGEAMVAVFTADGESYVSFPTFEDEISKIAEYSAIVKTAKSKNAVLIITVNSARTKANPTDAELKNYRWGDFDATNSRRCILLTASGPGLRSCSLELGFDIRDGQVQFDREPELMDKIELNLLPDWPKFPARSAN
jgi:hypothetical protein